LRLADEAGQRVVDLVSDARGKLRRQTRRLVARVRAPARLPFKAALNAFL
jgi:hypothetical protein